MENFKSFTADTPKEFTSIEVKLEDGSITRGYYVKWSNFIYLKFGSNNSQATEWRYSHMF